MLKAGMQAVVVNAESLFYQGALASAGAPLHIEEAQGKNVNASTRPT